jgi:hypothetical protein
VARFTGPSGGIIDSAVSINDLGDLSGPRTIQYGGEFRNPTGGQTYVLNLVNGQKQYLPVGTTTNVVLTGPTGPGSYTLRVYHYAASSFINWATGGSGPVAWPGASMIRGSVNSGTLDIFSIYAVGSTGPDASKYYAMGGMDFRSI